jgi:uncharacterized protein YmfQ (DUF2313 family)
VSNPGLEFELLEEAAPEAPQLGPLSAEVYARMLKALLPPGKLWRLDPDSNLSLLLLACGDELARVDARGWDLIEEADPATTTELLEDFERILGLTAEGTEAERRSAVVGRLVRRQRFRPADFRAALASSLGQDAADVDVRERTAAWAASVGAPEEIFRFFVYRDPGIPGDYSIAGAQAIVDVMQPSHTVGHVIESIDMRCDEVTSLCDRDIIGA